MTTIISRPGFVAITFVLAIICSGCTTNYNLSLKPVTSYPASQRLNMSVDLLLEKEFAGDGSILFERHSTIRKLNYHAPGTALGKSAEALAQAMFREVHVVYSLSAANSAPPMCSAIVKPRIVKGEDVAGGLWGAVIVYLEWTVMKPNGDVVWKKSFRGQSSGGVRPDTQAQRALETVFSTSFTDIYQSPAIRALGQPPSSTAARKDN